MRRNRRRSNESKRPNVSSSSAGHRRHSTPTRKTDVESVSGAGTISSNPGIVALVLFPPIVPLIASFFRRSSSSSIPSFRSKSSSSSSRRNRSDPVALLRVPLTSVPLMRVPLKVLSVKLPIVVLVLFMDKGASVVGDAVGTWICLGMINK